MIIKSSSEKETQKIAFELAIKYSQGKVIALTGDLGAGKTIFAQGFAKGLKISQPLLSPTFILMRQYDLPHSKKGKLYHLDLYRLNNSSQIMSLGIDEIFANPANIILIEWGEKLGQNLPKNALKISITTLDKNTRQIYLED